MLAYSLIVLSIMFAIGIGISTVSIVQRKSAATTGSSVQSLQTADSGAQWAIKQLVGVVGTSSIQSINAFGSACNDSKNMTGAGLNGDFKLEFFAEDGRELLCSDLVADISSIKSTGTYQGTSRAVQVAVASTASSQIVGGGVCLSRVPNVSEPIADVWGVGVTCTGINGLGVGTGEINCPVGTTKALTYKIKGAGYGGEGAICFN